ncbi:MAG: NAD+ synthase, partial [Verrucomicrobia bacterium]|nr:NAD+ synthase [Verrucomicrobiota bacterium]
SPWHLGKNRVRHALLQRVAARLHCPLAYCNLVGGNDELIFDGASMVYDAEGRLVASGKPFEEDLILVDPWSASPIESTETPDEEKLFRALTLGLRDYLTKCGFRSVVLGLSGGIDSALTACIAAAAAGAENVLGVSLPSRYSSPSSLEDARDLAKNLGIRHEVVPIESAFQTMKDQLAPLFAGLPEDVTEENIQARIRGVYLMALSNKFGALLLTTGNKSEMAVGYCTLYGDMCGGLAVIGDVPKTSVYRLARWINREREVIPSSTLTKPPSAELRPGQKDQDTLPPYETLDAILDAYVVECRSVEEIVRAGFDPQIVRRVVRLIDASEYKRRQAAPVLKVASKAFGMGRRIPIAQRYREV